MLPNSKQDFSISQIRQGRVKFKYQLQYYIQGLPWKGERGRLHGGGVGWGINWILEGFPVESLRVKPNNFTCYICQNGVHLISACFVQIKYPCSSQEFTASTLAFVFLFTSSHLKRTELKPIFNFPPIFVRQLTTPRQR